MSFYFPKLQSSVVYIAWMYFPEWETHVNTLRTYLLEEEHAVQTRYWSLSDANRFIIRRGILRLLLAEQTDELPHNIRFAVNPWGKLNLVFPQLSLRFNMSDVQEWAVIAMAKEVVVGVDVERKRILDYEDIAKTVFSPQEQAHLASCDASVKQETFFSLWTQKEALFKAQGRGLSSESLQKVTLSPHSPYLTVPALPYLITRLKAPTHHTAFLASDSPLEIVVRHIAP